MKIHFITEGEPFLQSLVAALSSVHEVSVSTSGEALTPNIEAVVVAEGISTTHPQWQKKHRSSSCLFILMELSYTNFIS